MVLLQGLVESLGESSLSSDPNIRLVALFDNEEVSRRSESCEGEQGKREQGGRRERAQRAVRGSRGRGSRGGRRERAQRAVRV